MHLTRKHFFQSSLSPLTLRTDFGNEAPSVKSVYSWYNEFKLDRVILNDKWRNGRPISAVTDENLTVVRNMIKEGNLVTYRIIRAA